MSDVQFLVRGAFRPLTGATAERVAQNAWRVTIPRTDALKRVMRMKSMSPEAFDGTTFLIGDDESWSAVGESGDDQAIIVTVLT